MYCPAKDTSSAEALRVRTDLPAQEISWLQRHGRASGDLYGILPLIIGMPVAMSDHIDRSIDQRIIRGRVCRVYSCISANNETSAFDNGSRIT